MADIVGAVVGPRLGVWVGDDGSRKWMGMGGRPLDRAAAKKAWNALTWEERRRAALTVADVFGRPVPIPDEPEEAESA